MSPDIIEPAFVHGVLNKDPLLKSLSWDSIFLGIIQLSENVGCVA